VDRFIADPSFISRVVRFDLPLLGDVNGLRGIHLQCQIGTDTVALARLGASMTGIDFSPAAIAEARRLADRTGADARFIEADVYDAVSAAGEGGYDLVFTGIGALCWLPASTGGRAPSPACSPRRARGASDSRSSHSARLPTRASGVGPSSASIWPSSRCRASTQARTTLISVSDASAYTAAGITQIARSFHPCPAASAFWHREIPLHARFSAGPQGTLAVQRQRHAQRGEHHRASIRDARLHRLIAGWECSLSKETAFAERAIRQAAAWRARQGHPLGDGAIHHSDAGSQYTSVRFAQTLLLAGLTPSVGTVGDALDNALAETTIGLYKTECTRDGSPFRARPVRTLADLEEITSAWVHWYNTSRLMHRLGRRPPAEAEAGYYRQAKDAA
jgi:transposase InsO family protein